MIYVSARAQNITEMALRLVLRPRARWLPPNRLAGRGARREGKKKWRNIEKGEEE